MRTHKIDDDKFQLHEFARELRLEKFIFGPSEKICSPTVKRELMLLNVNNGVIPILHSDCITKKQWFFCTTLYKVSTLFMPRRK